MYILICLFLYVDIQTLWDEAMLDIRRKLVYFAVFLVFAVQI